VCRGGLPPSRERGVLAGMEIGLGYCGLFSCLGATKFSERPPYEMTKRKVAARWGSEGSGRPDSSGSSYG